MKELLFDISMIVAVEDEANEEEVAAALLQTLGYHTVPEAVRQALKVNLPYYQGFFFDTNTLHMELD